MLTASFSTLKDYEECPHRVYLNKIEKHRDEGNEYTIRGNEVHSAIEAYIESKTDEIELPNALNIVDTYRDLMRGGANVQVEQNWGFDSEWNATGYYDNPWLRVKCDVFFEDDDCETGEIVDWKTGKKRIGKHTDQAMLYATAALHRYPHLKEVTARFVYVDHATEPFERTFNQQQAALMRSIYEDRIAVMQNDNKFLPKPSKGNCSYCSMANFCKYRHDA